MWVNKQGTKQSHYMQYTHSLWWWDKSYYREVKQAKPEGNITLSAFSPGVLQSRSQKIDASKVAQKKVQVRGKLDEIVSIPPIGFVRFKCGTGLAGSGETQRNYSQRDQNHKWEEKKAHKHFNQANQAYLLLR